MTSTAISGARILSVGTALPEKVLTNKDLEQMVDTSHEWIVERSGIHERRIGGTTADLAANAGRVAIERAGIDPATIDLLILATTSPDRRVPASASTVQEILGLQCGAMDLNAACSGFVYALVAAHGFIEMGHRRVLIIGAETLSRMTDWTDRTTCILFGDGAGAAIVQASTEDRGIIASYCGADGAYADTELLAVPAGGSTLPITAETVKKQLHKVTMKGREVFKLGVRIMPEAALHTLQIAGLTVEDIDLVIPHQANLRIIEAVGERIGVPSEKLYINVDRYGNTSAATVIIALDEALRSKKVNSGDLVLLVTFGAGLTWGASIIRM